jgi:hypothetical protein
LDSFVIDLVKQQKRFVEKIFRTEVPGFQSKVHAARNQRRRSVAPGYAGVDLWSDLHLLNAESTTTNARCFPAGYHELTHSARSEGASYCSERMLDEFSALLDAEPRMCSPNGIRLRRRVQKQRLRRIAIPL